MIPSGGVKQFFVIGSKAFDYDDTARMRFRNNCHVLHVLVREYPTDETHHSVVSEFAKFYVKYMHILEI